MSSAVAQSRNGVLADTEAVSAAVTTQRPHPLVHLATVLPLVPEASAAAGAGSALAAVASEAVSEAEEAAAIGADLGADLVEVTEVGMVVADLESATATATASQRAPHPVLVVQEAAALEAVGTAATREAVMVVATATPVEAHDTAATDRHATATAVAAAIANPLEVETVAVATVTAIGNATTTANAPTMAKVATTNHASKGGTERFLGLLQPPILHASGRFILFRLRESTVSSSPHAQNVGKQPCLTPQSSAPVRHQKLERSTSSVDPMQFDASPLWIIRKEQGLFFPPKARHSKAHGIHRRR